MLSILITRAAAGLGLIGLLAACATGPSQPVIPRVGYVPIAQIVPISKFITTTLSRDNFDSVAKSCVPTWTDMGTKRVLSDWKLPLSRGTVQTSGHNGHASYLYITGSAGICIQTSDNKYPILANEVLYKTANPAGVPPSIEEEWYSRITKQIAVAGTATMIYQFANGNAQVANYWVDLNTTMPSRLNYWVEFKRVGQWSAKPTDIVVSHPAMSSFIIAKYGDQHSKSLLGHRD
jgi:hypothetical protein